VLGRRRKGPCWRKGGNLVVKSANLQPLRVINDPQIPASIQVKHGKAEEGADSWTGGFHSKKKSRETKHYIRLQQDRQSHSAANGSRETRSGRKGRATLCAALTVGRVPV
jgi:hypothetical protein